LFLHGLGFLEAAAEKLQAYGLAALEVFDDEVGVAGEAFFPGINPLGIGEFGPDVHGVGW